MASEHTLWTTANSDVPNWRGHTTIHSGYRWRPCDDLQVNTNQTDRIYSITSRILDPPYWIWCNQSRGTYLYDTLRSFQLSVRYDPWRYKLRSGATSKRTCLEQKAATPSSSLALHYDTISISPGANDDGSGVAVVLLLVLKSSVSIDSNSTLRSSVLRGKNKGSSLARICPECGEKRWTHPCNLNPRWCRQCYDRRGW